MIPLIDVNKLTPVSYEGDTAPEGEKTVFWIRTLTLSQCNEINGRLAECQGKPEAHAVAEVVRAFPFYVAKIDKAGCVVPYEERELGGKHIMCVARKFVDELLPLEVVTNVFAQAIRAQQVSVAQEKKSESAAGSETTPAG